MPHRAAPALSYPQAVCGAQEGSCETGHEGATAAPGVYIRIFGGVHGVYPWVDELLYMLFLLFIYKVIVNSAFYRLI